ncbi:MAG: hypothetical protein F6K34_09025, partial [Okeania sp. SIO4D6]|nr:hypothetical protein [Okeania sp. SIO4D6]
RSLAPTRGNRQQGGIIDNLFHNRQQATGNRKQGGIIDNLFHNRQQATGNREQGRSSKKQQLLIRLVAL